MNYKLAIFDLDGTILNTLEDLTDSANHTLEQLGYPTRTLDEVRSFIGNGVAILIRRCAPEGLTEEEHAIALKEFRAYYKLHSADKTRPYDGIIKLLSDLREAGVRTAVVSNKIDFAVQDLVKEFYQGVFDFATGEREGMPIKPNPALVNMVLSELNTDASDAVYIGDTNVDLETAANANMDVIGVDWGFRGCEALKELGCTKLAYTPDDIYKLIVG